MCFNAGSVVTVPTPTSAADPLIGLRLNDYVVQEAIAEGGMGIVYRGVHPLIQKRAAIKVLKLGNQSDVDFEQLVREAQAANSISHQNIVDIFGLGRLPDQRPYIIMEYLEGEALDARLVRSPLPHLEVVQLLFDICAPLAAAHRAQIIHRDLKPSNVYLCSQPGGGYFLKLLDFGLAKKSATLNGVTEQTTRATVSGTPDYMAPEQAQGKAISPRSDLYALGCMAYEMTARRVPFVAPTPFDVMVAHVRAPTPRASTVATLPPELDQLIFRLMAKDPDERPQSADEVRELLLPLLEKLGTEAGAAATKGPRPSMSGEFVVRAARASGARAAEQFSRADTDEGLPPAPKEAPTDDALPPARSNTKWIVAGALSLIVIVACIAALGASGTHPQETPETVAAAAPVIAPPAETKPVETKPADTPPPDAKPEAKPEEPKVAEAKPPEELPEDELEDLAPLPSGVKKKEVREVKAPTEQQLKKRLASLEERLRKATESGASANPAALQYLAKYRVQATMADTPAQRGKLARQMDQWERLFLSR